MGILDNFSPDDPATAGLLNMAGSMLNASGPSPVPHSLGQILGGGAVAGLGGYQAARQHQIDQEKELLQMSVLKQQAAAAMRKNQLINNYLATSLGQDGESQDNGAQKSSLPPMPTPLDNGGFYPPSDYAPQGGQSTAQPTAGASRERGVVNGVPVSAIAADLAFNEGKNIGEWSFKRGVPNMQISNGVAIDLNRVQPGFLPSLSTSSNGQTSMVTIDPATGQPRVSAPAGATETYKGFQAAGKQAENENTLAPLDRIDPQTGRPYAATVAQLVGRVAGTLPQNFTDLAPNLRAFIQRQADMDGRPVAVDMATPDGRRVKGEVSPSFNGFAGPADLARAAAQVKVETDPNLGYRNAASANMAEYEKGLNGRVASGQDLMMRINESRDALSKFKAGGGMEMRQQLAKIAQASGASNAVVDGIAGGDLSAAQEFQKLSAQQAMEALKQSMGGSGRISQAEFKVFQQNNPNLDTDPRAIEKVFNFATKVYQRDKAEQDAFANFKRIPGADISAFPNWWASQSGVPAEQITGAARGTPPVGNGSGGNGKFATLSDITATARASGKSTAQVTADLRAAGYTIGGK